MKKKILRNLMAITLLLCTCFTLVACTSYVKPWGKTLSYNSMTDITKTTYNIDGKNLTLYEIFEEYFDNIDWETSLGAKKTNLKNAGGALSNVNQKAKSNIGTDENKDLTFKFGTAKEKQVEINGKTYPVKEKPETKPKQYEITITTSEQTETITLIPLNADCFYYTTDIASDKTSALPISKYELNIKFTSPITTENGTTKTITVTYYSVYKAE